MEAISKLGKLNEASPIQYWTVLNGEKKSKASTELNDILDYLKTLILINMKRGHVILIYIVICLMMTMTN